jgi:hypothetical protein
MSRRLCLPALLLGGLPLSAAAATPCEDAMRTLAGYPVGQQVERFVAPPEGFQPHLPTFFGKELFKDYREFSFADGENPLQRSTITFRHYQGALFSLDKTRSGSRHEVEPVYQRALALIGTLPAMRLTSQSSTWDGVTNSSQHYYECDGRYRVELHFSEAKPWFPELGLFFVIVAVEDHAASEQMRMDREAHCQEASYKAQFPFCRH